MIFAFRLKWMIVSPAITAWLIQLHALNVNGKDADGIGSESPMIIKYQQWC